MASSDLAALTAALGESAAATPAGAEAFKGKKLTAKEALEAALTVETDEEEKKLLSALVALQGDVDGVVAEYMEERRKLQDKFLTKLLEPYSKRRALVNGTAGGASAPAEQTPAAPTEGVRNFWLTVLQNCGATRVMIEDHDEAVLEYLTDIEWRVVSGGEGFELLFHFSTNPHFSNTVLTKSYPIKSMLHPFNEYDFDWRAVKGTEIKWAEGKDVTVEPAGAGGDDDSTMPRPSFFHFFNCEDVDEEELKSMSPSEKRMYQGEVNRDFYLGNSIKDKLVPNAQKFYIGDITGVDSDFEPEEEEDDGDWMQGMADDGEGMSIPPEMLQALMAGGMLGGAGGDSDEEVGSKGRNALQALDEDDEEDGDDEAAAAAIRAAISGALSGEQGGSIADSLGGQPVGEGEGGEQQCQQQ